MSQLLMQDAPLGDAARQAQSQVPPGPLLRVSGVVVRFGGVIALDGVSFDVGRSQICGLIGPNGSGKTTLFNCISGIYRCNAGDILFEGSPLTGQPRHRMAGLGIGRTFQNVALFRTMSVRDNMLVGAHHLGRSGFIANALRLPIVRREDREIAEQTQLSAGSARPGCGAGRAGRGAAVRHAASASSWRAR